MSFFSPTEQLDIMKMGPDAIFNINPEDDEEDEPESGGLPWQQQVYVPMMLCLHFV